VDIVVKSRHHEVTDRFRRHAVDKLSKVEKLDERAISLTVELCEERNPRQSEQRDRIELTLNSPGPVVRAEAAAGDPYSALDIAVGKLEAQMRKAADRRKLHRNRKAIADSIKHIPPMADLPPSTQPLLTKDGATSDATLVDLPAYSFAGPDAGADHDGTVTHVNGSNGAGPMVVREKTHTAVPMTLDQALYEMELVGHDFYLYVDKESGLPAVVYRRHAYDYGVIHLEANDTGAPASANGSPSDRMPVTLRR
jgi:ribosomal subunit interface protein